MTPKQLEEARATIEDNPVVITVVDRTGNTNSIKKINGQQKLERNPESKWNKENQLD